MTAAFRSPWVFVAVLAALAAFSPVIALPVLFIAAAWMMARGDHKPAAVTMMGGVVLLVLLVIGTYTSGQ